jgi:hypothetical protein
MKINDPERTGFLRPRPAMSACMRTIAGKEGIDDT